MSHPIISGTLLIAAGVLALICSIGVAVMRDPLQRLHFSAPVVSLSAGLVAIAVWLEETDAQARVKVLIIAAVLFTMNSILTHATARGVYIRRSGKWDITPEFHVTLVGKEGRQEKLS